MLLCVNLRRELDLNTQEKTLDNHIFFEEIFEGNFNSSSLPQNINY